MRMFDFSTPLPPDSPAPASFPSRACVFRTRMMLSSSPSFFSPPFYYDVILFAIFPSDYLPPPSSACFCFSNGVDLIFDSILALSAFDDGEGIFLLSFSISLSFFRQTSKINLLSFLPVWDSPSLLCLSPSAGPAPLPPNHFFRSLFSTAARVTAYFEESHLSRA